MIIASWIFWVFVAWFVVFLPVDLFSSKFQESRKRIYQLNMATVAYLKSKHADFYKAYDIGLFGNSRIENVSAVAVDIKDKTLFNFCVGGSSILDSSLLIEDLYMKDKLPALNIVMMDNATLAFHSKIGFRGNLLHTLYTASSTIFSQPVPYKLAADEVKRNALKAWWRSFKELWKWGEVKAKANLLLPSLFDPLGRPYNVQSDGSLVFNRIFGPMRQQRCDFSGETQDSYIHETLGVVKSGLQIIKGIEEKETAQFIIYESPIIEGIWDHCGVSKEKFEKLRAAMFSECQKLQLDCRPAPQFTMQEYAWRDLSHAPVELLAPYIRSLITGTNNPYAQNTPIK